MNINTKLTEGTRGVSRIARVLAAKSKKQAAAPETTASQDVAKAYSAARGAERSFYAAEKASGEPLGLAPLAHSIHYAGTPERAEFSNLADIARQAVAKRKLLTISKPKLKLKQGITTVSYEPLGVENNNDRSNLLERIVGLAHPILTPAIKLAISRVNSKSNKSEKNLEKAVQLAKQFSKLSKAGADEMAKKSKIILSRPFALSFMQKRAPLLQNILYREPLLLEVDGPSPNVRPDLIGKSISGGLPVAGATTTANLGLRSSPTGYGFFGKKTLSLIDKKIKNQQKCYKQAGFSHRKQEKCDEIPAPVGGVSLLRRVVK